MNNKVEQFITFTTDNSDQPSYINILNINNSCIIRQNDIYVSLENASVLFTEPKGEDTLLYGYINTNDTLQFKAILTEYGVTIDSIFNNPLTLKEAQLDQNPSS